MSIIASRIMADTEFEAIMGGNKYDFDGELSDAIRADLSGKEEGFGEPSAVEDDEADEEEDQESEDEEDVALEVDDESDSDGMYAFICCLLLCGHMYETPQWFLPFVVLVNIVGPNHIEDDLEFASEVYNEEEVDAGDADEDDDGGDEDAEEEDEDAEIEIGDEDTDEDDGTFFRCYILCHSLQLTNCP